MPPIDFTTPAAAVTALASPNLSTRATALERLAQDPDHACDELTRARSLASDSRLRGRLAWALSMLPGKADQLPLQLAAETEDMQIVAVRMQRLMQGDVVRLVEKLAASPSAAVRRECVIALRGIPGERANRLWAELASRHQPGDRWEVEALGIGADSVSGFDGASLWDGRLEAWLAKMGSRWKSPAGREIVWRSRAAATPALLCELIGDPLTTTSESLSLVRALDFQTVSHVHDVLRPLVKSFRGPDEKVRVILPELVARLAGSDIGDANLAKRVDEAIKYVAGTQAFVSLVERFQVKHRVGELLTLAAAEGTPEALAANAAQVAFALGGAEPMRQRLVAGDASSKRLLMALGIRGDRSVIGLLKDFLVDPSTTLEFKSAAVTALSRSNQGAKELVAMAKANELPGNLPQAAAVAIAACPWGDVRQAAIEVLPMPRGKGGSLPPLAKLIRQKGDAGRGKAVFAGAGTCAKCHVVGGEGRNVGPNLSQIGGKLGRQALYEAILAPSAAISHSYETFTALLDDGRSVTGLLVSQSPESVVIRGADGIDIAIPAGDVEELVKQPVSLMPADLATAITADELVDLVTWLETLR
jgi:putative heme-binding domain-containing protein